MAYYYWNPTAQQQPIYQFPMTQSPQTPQMPTQLPGTTPLAPPGAPTFLQGEQSYIENILRLNRGKIGTFYFTVPEAVVAGSQTNTKRVRGYVEAAGRDHVILRDASTDHRFLFPMIYFDFAEFDEELAYFNQTPGLPSRR
ncbi:spore coat protein GerQ [Ureibacillus sp. NPDC094379]